MSYDHHIRTSHVKSITGMEYETHELIATKKGFVAKRSYKALIASRQDYIHVTGISRCEDDENSVCSREAIEDPGQVDIKTLAGLLKVGDIVFIQVKALPFQKVSQATASWTNHVGIIVDTSDRIPIIAESTFPLSKSTSLYRFIARSRHGRVVVRRLSCHLSADQEDAITAAAQKRLGTFYDTGFNIHSRRQFCSRFVREVLAEATGNLVGDIENFMSLLSRNPTTDMGFWRLWYFGRIPWHRQTVTPASLLHSPLLHSVFNGYVSHVILRHGKSDSVAN